jgi:hypothetical protein
LLDPKNHRQNVWVLDLPTQGPVEWISDSRDYLVALDRGASSFFLLNPRSMRQIAHWKWDPQSEIIDVLMCPGRTQLLIEQPQQGGVTRFVRFRSEKPEAYTVFDLSSGKRQSDLLQALTQDCLEIYTAGPYGIQRIRY